MGAALRTAAAAVGMPLDEVDLPEPEVLRAYEQPLVLVRPDGHVAWRGSRLPDDVAALVDRLRGT